MTVSSFSFYSQRRSFFQLDELIVGRNYVPKSKHLRGVSSKEQRQYEHIKKSAQRSGRYGKRAKEVAARTVMKQHKRKGHRKGK